MSARKSPSAAQLDQLIEQAKAVRPVSPATRLRVLKRAQSSTLAPSALLAADESVQVKGSWRRAWFVAAAGAPLFAAAAALALHGGNHSAATGAAPLVSGVPLVASARPTPAPTVSSLAPEREPARTAPPTAQPSAKRAPESSAQESYAAELLLLRRAHAAYGSGDFASALRLLAAHARQFPNGRLAEEREALRVRALSSSGQSDSARRAAHAFADRFPRSVLLSRTMSAADAGK
jgi:TolA-binding protein